MSPGPNGPFFSDSSGTSSLKTFMRAFVSALLESSSIQRQSLPFSCTFPTELMVSSTRRSWSILPVTVT